MLLPLCFYLWLPIFNTLSRMLSMFLAGVVAGLVLVVSSTSFSYIHISALSHVRPLINRLFPCSAFAKHVRPCLTLSSDQSALSTLCIRQTRRVRWVQRRTLVWLVLRRFRSRSCFSIQHQHALDVLQRQADWIIRAVRRCVWHFVIGCCFVVIVTRQHGRRPLRSSFTFSSCDSDWFGL